MKTTKKQNVKPRRLHQQRKHLDEATPSPLLRLSEALRFCGYSRSVFFDLISKGELPAPVKLRDGGRAVGWIREELEDWLAKRIAARDAKRAESEARA